MLPAPSCTPSASTSGRPSTPIAVAAIVAGFAHQSHMATTMRRVLGHTPATSFARLTNSVRTCKSPPESERRSGAAPLFLAHLQQGMDHVCNRRSRRKDRLFNSTGVARSWRPGKGNPARRVQGKPAERDRIRSRTGRLARSARPPLAQTTTPSSLISNIRGLHVVPSGEPPWVAHIAPLPIGNSARHVPGGRLVSAAVASARVPHLPQGVGVRGWHTLTQPPNATTDGARDRRAAP